MIYFFLSYIARDHQLSRLIASIQPNRPINTGTSNIDILEIVPIFISLSRVLQMNDFVLASFIFGVMSHRASYRVTKFIELKRRIGKFAIPLRTSSNIHEL